MQEAESDSDDGVFVTPKREIQQTQCHSLADSEQKRRRHFSFEPGDDFAFPTALAAHLPESVPQSQGHSTESSPLSADAPKPSKIPSPIQQPAFGNVRREGSVPTLRSLDSPVQDDRRDSRSSVLTVFRENSHGSMRDVKTCPVHAAIRAYEKSSSENTTPR